MRKWIVLWGIAFSLLLSGACLAQTDRSAEVQALMAALDSASSSKRVNAAKVISRSGLTDQELYNKIATLLKNSYATKTDSDHIDADHIDEMAWLCKALAASGDSQYRPLFEEIAAATPSSKLKHYAEQSNSLLEEYAQRSRILNETKSWDDSLSAEDNRLVNMLNSDNVALKRDAAKAVVRNFNTDAKVFAAAAAALTTMFAENNLSSTRADTMAWLCKALAASGDKKYIEILQQIHDGTSNTKLLTYTSKALQAL